MRTCPFVETCLAFLRELESRPDRELAIEEGRQEKPQRGFEKGYLHVSTSLYKPSNLSSRFILIHGAEECIVGAKSIGTGIKGQFLSSIEFLSVRQRTRVHRKFLISR